jgi:hypothetical protein
MIGFLGGMALWVVLYWLMTGGPSPYYRPPRFRFRFWRRASGRRR